MQGEKEFYTIKDIAEGLGITATRATQLVHKIIRANPATQRIIKTKTAKGRYRYEMHESLYKAEFKERLEDAQWSAGIKPAKPDPEPLRYDEGLHHQIEADGSTSYIMVYNEAEYQQLYETISAFSAIKAANGSIEREMAQLRAAHDKHVEQLQEAYNANIENYKEQTKDLRKRLDEANVVLLNIIKAHNVVFTADQQRNYIAAGIKPKE